MALDVNSPEMADFKRQFAMYLCGAGGFAQLRSAMLAAGVIHLEIKWAGDETPGFIVHLKGKDARR